MKFKLALAFFGSFIVSETAFAQNTGGVFGPVVKEGHRSFQYRAAVNPDNALGQTGFAQRLHYQQAIDTNFMWRILGQTRKTDASDIDFDFLQAELFWQLTDDKEDYQTGLRFDARLRDEGRAEQLGLNWMNQWKLSDAWSARFLTLTALQLGNNAADGLNIQTRGRVTYKTESKVTLGVELYNNFGNTGNIGGFDDQSHTIGPIVSLPIAKDLSIFAGTLHGISDAAPDTEFRLWLTKTL